MKKIKKHQIFKGFSSRNDNKNVLYDIDIVKQDLMNHLFTRVGERVMMPKYGCIIWDLLFDPMTENIKDLITDDLQNIVEADTRLSLDGVIVEEYEHGIIVQMSVSYLPFGVYETFQVEFDKRTLENF